ncbi:unnamed protein product, partial [Prorocentrum cordatum]
AFSGGEGGVGAKPASARHGAAWDGCGIRRAEVDWDAEGGALIFIIEMDSVMELLNSAAKRQKLNNEISEPEILELVSRREAARQARRFEESDAIRQDSWPPSA